MSLGKWIKKGIVSFSIATANVEKNALSQEGNNLDEGNASVLPMGQNQLMQDLNLQNVRDRLCERDAQVAKLQAELRLAESQAAQTAAIDAKIAQSVNTIIHHIPTK